MTDKPSGYALTTAREWPDEDIIRLAKKAFPESIPYSKAVRALDIGCGNGRNLLFALHHGFHLYGCDMEPACKNAAETLFEQHECYFDGGWFRLGGYPTLPWPDAYADLIIDCQTSQHLRWSEHEAAYRDVWRVLKHGGYFALTHLTMIDDRLLAEPVLGEECTYQSDGLRVKDERAIFPDNGIMCDAPVSQLLLLLRRVGFEEVSTETTERTYYRRLRAATWANILARKP